MSRDHIRGVGVDAAVDAARPTVLKALAQLESERNLDILYACESGSRAWGFASSDSDFDVRFIFRRPANTYLMLRPPKDAFDVHLQGDLDLGGWDIRKAAELMRKSNPPLLEWLDSPIVYRADGEISTLLARLRYTFFDAKKAAYHYLSMAARVSKSYLHDAQPKRKKYLYALRPLACIRFIELHKTCPPTALDQVLDQIDWPTHAIQAVLDLVAKKTAGGELGHGPRDTTLDRLITDGLQHAEQIAPSLPTSNEPNDQLDEMVARAILESPFR